MDTEVGRLEKLYAEMGDEHLLDLNDDRDDLTEEAQMVLTKELRRRGIVPEPREREPVEQVEPTEEPERERGFGPGIPGVFPAGASVVEQALEPERIRKGMASLIAFYDGIELSKACAILEDAELQPSIEAIDGDAMSGVPPRFEIWLGEDQIEQAKTLLRLKMGLFPAAEVDDAVPVGLTGEDQVVAQFESETEAEEVRSILGAEGFAATVERETDTPGWVVVVPAEEHDRALDVVAARLGMG